MRNTYNWDKAESTQFWYLIKDEYGGIEELPRKVRNQVKKSLKTYEVRKVSASEMAEKGYDLYNRSRERFQNSSLLLTKESFAGWVNNPRRCCWLSIHRETGNAMAFAIVSEHPDYCDYTSMGVDPNAPSSTYPMYGLLMEMNRYYLEECGMKYVLDGARSITEHSNIQSFLEEKFLFRKAYCDIKIYYRPWIRVIVKLLFPFRRHITHGKVVALLNQEAMQRGLNI